MNSFLMLKNLILRKENHEKREFTFTLPISELLEKKRKRKSQLVEQSTSGKLSSNGAEIANGGGILNHDGNAAAGLADSPTIAVQEMPPLSINVESIVHKIIEENRIGLDGIEDADAIELREKIIANVGTVVGITEFQVVDYAALTADDFSTRDPDFSLLAGRLAVHIIHKTTKDTFSLAMKEAPGLSDEFIKVVEENSDKLDNAIIHANDKKFDFAGIRAMETSMLIRNMEDHIVERPQYMFMRVAVALHLDNIDEAIEHYNNLSMMKYIHASITNTNAGKKNGQIANCYVTGTADSSPGAVVDAFADCGHISIGGSGVGLDASSIPAEGSYDPQIGKSKGAIKAMQALEGTSKMVTQGATGRPAAFAVYWPPWHKDIFKLLEMQLNTTSEEDSCRKSIFTGLMIPDVFMRRVRRNKKWTLMCPTEFPNLLNKFGKEFEKEYKKCEKAKKHITVVKARDVYKAIIKAQVETGMPFMIYTDHVNQKSNHQNLGMIKCANLCTEIVQYSGIGKNAAVCSCASISLPYFVKEEQKILHWKEPNWNKLISRKWSIHELKSIYQFDELRKTMKFLVKTCDKMIDRNVYRRGIGETNNKENRPLGLGLQGLADTFMLLHIPFESKLARQLNKLIAETLYFAALEASCELAQQFGPYKNYDGSPVSKGQLQFDMWGGVKPSALWDWQSLRNKIKERGVRNSLLLGYMPTATTARVLQNNDSIEPYQSNIYSRGNLSGDHKIPNRHLLKQLKANKCWNLAILNELIAKKKNYKESSGIDDSTDERGSIQNIKGIPKQLKQIFKTIWEIKQKTLVELAAERGPYVDQSQSLNIYMAVPTENKMASMNYYVWKMKLKGTYYIRTRPAAVRNQITVDKNALSKKE